MTNRTKAELVEALCEAATTARRELTAWLNNMVGALSAVLDSTTNLQLDVSEREGEGG